MASVYKSVSKTKSNGSLRDDDADNKPKNRQRLLILSSRGVTYRFVSNVQSSQSNLRIMLTTSLRE